MKKSLVLLHILICSYSTAYNQVIKGTVLDKFTKSPIDYALVYFNGTFVGTRSDQNGYFNLNISRNSTMPLTISALGYYSLTVTDLLTDTDLLIYLTPKIFELKEVVVTASAREVANAKKTRKTNIKLFKQEFLGATLNAQKCEIINENDIIITYDSNNETLKAFASKPIIIDNKALGYSVFFYLDKFEYSKKMESCIFIGNIIFKEDWISNKIQKQRFERRRKSTYLGSKMQFFRALWENKLDSTGFRVINSTYKGLSYDKLVIQTDSLEKANPIKYLKYPDDLYITYYTKVPSTRITIIKERVFFDKNGYFDPLGIMWLGEMAKQRIADWLPYEYFLK